MIIKNSIHRLGYILPLTLILLSGIMMVVSYLFTKSSLYAPYARINIDTIKAQELTLGGLEIAMAQLYNAGVKKNSKTSVNVESTDIKLGSSEKIDPNKIPKQLLTFLLPILNRWQDYILTLKNDGVDGRIQFCIMCENGKIDINTIFDRKKGVFKGEFNNIMPGFFGILEKKLNTKDMLKELIAFLKERVYPVNDATELLTLKSFSVFKDKQFYDPSHDKKNLDTFYLTDIFTTHSDKENIEPWLLSHSLLMLFGGKPVNKDDVVSNAIKGYKVNNVWAKDWDILLKELYGVEFKNLPKKIDTIFTSTFEPTLFSVLVHGTVGSVTERLYAIIARTKRVQDNVSVYDITIKRIYWL